MRKLRDFDSELKALTDKAKALKERRVRQLGELVGQRAQICSMWRHWPACY